MNRREFGFGAGALLAAPAILGVKGAFAQEQVRWSYIGIQPFTQPFVAEILKGFDRITERTEGRFVVERSNIRETPYTASEGLSIIRDDLADFMEWYPGYVTNTYPALAGPELPFITPEFGPIEIGVAAVNRAWDSASVKAVRDEVFAAHGVVAGTRLVWEPISIWMNGDFPDPTDLQNSAVRANTREAGDLINATNGVAQFIPITDVYPALQRNSVQGISGSAAGVMTYKLNEVMKNGIITNCQFTTATFLVRKKALDALPADLREIYDEEMAAVQETVSSLTAPAEAAFIQQAKDAGLNVRDVTPEEYAKLRDIAEKNVWSMWKDRVGADGDKLLAEVQAAISAA